MLHLHHANHLEDLAGKLRAKSQKHRSAKYSHPEIIADTGHGDQRMADDSPRGRYRHQRQHPMAASSETALANLSETPLMRCPTANAFSADALAWRVLPILEDTGFTSRHPALVTLPDRTASALHRWQLARQMGRLYEQYLVFRPDWVILKWERGDASTLAGGAVATVSPARAIRASLAEDGASSLFEGLKARGR